jgi:carotenoid cleavage dioxygenase-like enzyme
VAQPFTVKSTSMLWSNKGYIDHFAWRGLDVTRLILIDRAGGAVREHVAEPFFFFHTVNAFERGDQTVLDLLAYPDAGIVDALPVERMLAALPDLRPSLVRLVMRPGAGQARFEHLGDAGFEFPAIAYRRASGQPYRYVYGAAEGPQGDGWPSAIVKVDLDTGASRSFGDGDHVFGEPLFVARPGGAAEDDGVLLTVGSARDAEAALLAVLDARSMELLAAASVPSAIPLGFHGSFVSKEARERPAA